MFSAQSKIVKTPTPTTSSHVSMLHQNGNLQQFNAVAMPAHHHPNMFINGAVLNHHTAGFFNYHFQQKQHIMPIHQHQQQQHHQVHVNSLFIDMLARTANHQHLEHKQPHQLLPLPMSESLFNTIDPLKENNKKSLKRTISQIQKKDECNQMNAKKPTLKFGMDAILGNNNNKSSSSPSESSSRSPSPPTKTKRLHIEEKPKNNAEDLSDYTKSSANQISMSTAKSAHQQQQSQSSVQPAQYNNNNNSSNNDLNGYQNHQIQLSYNPTNSNQNSRTQYFNDIGTTNTQFHHYPHHVQSNPYLNPMLWPLKAKQRRGVLRRAVFSDHQRKGLEAAFLKQKYINKPDRKKLASKLCLKDSQVKIWFQNRRMKWRNTKERELMKARQGSNRKSNTAIDENTENTSLNQRNDSFNESFNSFKSSSNTDYEIKHHYHQQQQQLLNPYQNTNSLKYNVLTTSSQTAKPSTSTTELNSPNASSYLSSASSFSSCSESETSLLSPSSCTAKEQFDENSNDFDENNVEDDDDDEEEEVTSNNIQNGNLTLQNNEIDNHSINEKNSKEN